MAVPINIGDRFGRLTVVQKNDGRSWKCRCDCGRFRISTASNLRSGRNISCALDGCRWIKHGLSKTREYHIWYGIMQRCFNPNNTEYKHYGARGITVARQWRETPFAFIAYVGPRPSPKHSIDRIDNEGNYEPGNIRWATQSEQSKNKRTSVRVTYRRETMPILDALKIAGAQIPYCVFRYRWMKAGWTLERALETPSRATAK